MTIRLAQGLSQSAMADKFGISYGSYRNYEQGDRDPSLSLVIKILEEGKIDANWFLFGEGEKNSK